MEEPEHGKSNTWETLIKARGEKTRRIMQEVTDIRGNNQRVGEGCEIMNGIMPSHGKH